VDVECGRLRAAVAKNNDGDAEWGESDDQHEQACGEMAGEGDQDKAEDGLARGVHGP
jgi:hypothetical protein